MTDTKPTRPQLAETDNRVLLGAIAGPHGLRGEVKIKCFTSEPAAIAKYGPLEDQAGRPVKFKLRGQARGLAIARIDGVDDRNAAEALKGTRLYVGRARLPKPKRGEWYIADLIGLRAELADGTAVGAVKAAMNYGAGDILEIVAPDGRSVLLPFTKSAAPEVDIAGGRIVVDPPHEIEWLPEPESPS